MQAAGRTESLEELRAVALGMLARDEATAAGRQVSLVVHLPTDTGTCTGTALVEIGEGRLLTQAQVAAWCGNPDVTVVLKPVIDLHTPLSSRGYEVPDRIREHLELRDGTCVFAHCTRPARNAQKDHIAEFDPDDPEAGPTSTENLADLCQLHHNLKTHGGWTYVMIMPGVFLWRSPHGYLFLRDQHGTHDLGPGAPHP
jgi:hypothetical protein